jgi:hypothetical protein
MAKAINEIKNKPCIELETITIITFDKCNTNTNEPEFKEVKIQVIKGTGEKEIIFAKALADIQGQKCKAKDDNLALAAVPEWWQLRPEAKRPQLILMCGEKLPNKKIGPAKYVITIPHWKTGKLTAPPFVEFRKGSIEGILTLADNSKLIINGINSREVERIISILKISINTDMLKGSSQKIGERKGLPFKEIIVIPKEARFFAEGLADTKPTWRSLFDNK